VKGDDRIGRKGAAAEACGGNLGRRRYNADADDRPLIAEIIRYEVTEKTRSIRTPCRSRGGDGRTLGFGEAGVVEPGEAPLTGSIHVHDPVVGLLVPGDQLNTAAR